jgi:hypothetical protein
LDETITADDSANTVNGQAGATRCPGCARNRTKLVTVQGWHDRRDVPLCKRCASGLILNRGRIWALKLRPETDSPEGRP